MLFGMLSGPEWTSWGLVVVASAITVGLVVMLVRIQTAAIRRRNEALRQETRRHAETEARLRTVIAHSPVVLFALDREGVFTFSDGLGLKAIGLQPGEVVGRSAFEMYADRQVIVENLRCCLAGEEREWAVTLGESVFETRGGPLRDDDGRITGMIGLGRDVTERVRAERERRQLEQRLFESEKLEAIGRLAGGVAHDFNNLLTIIRGHLEMLQHSVPAEYEASRSLAEIERAQESAASLTEQLLAFARRQVMQPIVLDLNEALQRTRGLLRRVIGEHFELDFELAPELYSIEADPARIEQLAVNLMVNARDAMPRGGRIEVRTANVELARREGETGPEPGRYVELTVRDEGEGMTPDVRQRIFEPFFSTKSLGQGSGLGLSTVFGIVKQSGGDIRVQSAPGRGTTFRILFPASPVQKTESLPEKPIDDAGGGDETVLLVEDNDGVRGLLYEVLRAQGYEVLSAGEGREAIRLAREHGEPIDLLLTDVVMPGMGGKELAKEIRGSFPDIRVVYMSGHTDDSLPGGIKTRKGGDRFLAKPFSPKLLARLLREIFDEGR